MQIIKDNNNNDDDGDDKIALVNKIIKLNNTFCYNVVEANNIEHTWLLIITNDSMCHSFESNEECHKQ